MEVFSDSRILIGKVHETDDEIVLRLSEDD